MRVNVPAIVRALRVAECVERMDIPAMRSKCIQAAHPGCEEAVRVALAPLRDLAAALDRGAEK